MTPRERILAALAHRESDRVPVDLGSTESSGIMAVAYNRLKARLGIAGRTQVYDLGQMIAKVEPEVVRRVGSDAVPLLIEPREWKPWTLPDGSACEIPAKVRLRTTAEGDIEQLDDAGQVVARCPKDGFYFDTVAHPLAQAASPEDIDAAADHLRTFDWPGYMDEDFADLRRKALDLRRTTDHAIVGNLWVHVLAAGQILRGFEAFMMDLLTEPRLATHLLERQVDAYLPRIDRYVEAVGDSVDIIQVNDDLGTQLGPMLSPDLYRRMVKPHHARLWSYLKKKSGKPLLLHSCGSIVELIPDLIEMGVDALNPVQVSAAGMDSRRLKREFGRDLVFWGGGCDTQHVLSQKTPQEVRQEVRRRVDDFAPGGGFVFCQVHNIQATVPVENILAMYEELGTLN